MIVIGVDEVGRGCWAGPLAAGAVAFDVTAPLIPGLNDSKKLSKLRREQLDVVIRREAMATGVGWVEPRAIDISGITEAVKSAMEQAVSAVLEQLAESGYADEKIQIIVDGSYNFLKDFHPPHFDDDRLEITTLIGADGLVPAVSAASIIAKVARDTLMAGEINTMYPLYGFDKHVGYGTAAHIKALTVHGVTDIHRKSYKPIQKFLSQA